MSLQGSCRPKQRNGRTSSPRPGSRRSNNGRHRPRLDRRRRAGRLGGGGKSGAPWRPGDGVRGRRRSERRIPRLDVPSSDPRHARTARRRGTADCARACRRRNSSIAARGTACWESSISPRSPASQRIPTACNASSRSSRAFFYDLLAGQANFRHCSSTVVSSAVSQDASGAAVVIEHGGTHVERAPDAG